jgi:hypothetical protein
VTGNVLHGTVILPVPYRLRLDVRLQQCDRPRLDAAGGGTRAQVAWSLRIQCAPLRVAARVAYPLMRWGHDRVVDMAVAGFRQRALPGHIGANAAITHPATAARP